MIFEIDLHIQKIQPFLQLNRKCRFLIGYFWEEVKPLIL
jgi:hypothetical protein